MHLSVVSLWFNSCGLLFPLLFSYLAMPVRQMLSGVVDCSSPAEAWLSAATRAVARSAVGDERSAVGDEPGLLSCVFPYVLPYLLTHVPERVEVQWGDELVTEWCPGRHYRGCQDEKNTRNDCACCRSQKKFLFHNDVLLPATSNWLNATPVCDVCCAGWAISMVSRNWLHEARVYAREWKRCYCLPGCDVAWFINGWICKGAVAMEGVQKRRTQAERELFQLQSDLDEMDDCVDYFFSISRTRRHVREYCIRV